MPPGPRWRTRHSNLHRNRHAKRQVRTIDAAPLTAKSRGHRLAALDGLRLLAALGVLAYHYTGIDRDFWGARPLVEFPSLHHLSRYGYLGVELFFVISGFVILLTAYDRTIGSFAGSRVARLYPAYWVAVVLTFALQQVWDGGIQTSNVDALANLTMVQSAFGMEDVQGAFWTLWVELRFYLLIGLFMAVGMTRQRLLAFAVLWPVVAQVAERNGSGFLSSMLLPTYAPYFAAGIVLFLLSVDRRNLVCWLALGFNWVLCVREAVEHAPRASHLAGAPVSPVLTGLAVTLFIGAVYACSHGPLSRIRWGWLTLAGALTYPLYLVHGQVGYFVIDSLQQGMHSYLVLGLATVASLLLAWVIHRFVERPSAKPLRRGVEDSVRRLVSASR